MLRTCRLPTVPWQGLRQSGRCLPGDERDRTGEDRGKGKWETARKGDKTRTVARAGQPATASGGPDPDSTYDGESIFDYIDGAGEVYRAYNMRGCLSRRYTATGLPTIVLDIFDMGSSEDAFGVFTHDRDGKTVDVGQEGLYRQGWLSFWKGRFFVSIYMERETVDAKEAAYHLARAGDSLIGDEGPKPPILLKLPPEGLQDRSVRFLHHPLLLNYHYYLSDENILNLGKETDALLASYSRGGKRARFLLVHYPSPERARGAHEKFLASYLPEEGTGGAVLLENGKWSASLRKGRLLAVVLEADSRLLAESLLREVKAVP